MKREYQPMLGHTDDWRTNLPSMTVLEPEPQQRFSGLLDVNGNKLMVSVKSDPVGFVHFPVK